MALSAREGFIVVKTTLKWMDHIQLLTVKLMRYLAAQKWMKTTKQPTF